MKLQPRFKAMTGLWRIHWYLSRMLEWHVEGRDDLIVPAIATLCRCIAQVAREDGSWESAHLMMILDDPLDRCKWEGSDDEMQDVWMFREALKKMKKKADDA